MTRAKFKVTAKSQTGEDSFAVTLMPVTGGSVENDSFYKWTPGGSILLQTINKAAYDGFEFGKEYYVDFSEATATPAQNLTAPAQTGPVTEGAATA